MTKSIATRAEAEVVPAGALAVRDELSVEEVVAQVEKIQQVVALAMKKDEHYGVIPGTKKPTLLKPGAEKLCLTFRLDPEYVVAEQFFDDRHYYVRATCTLFHIPTGNRVASGIGSCTSRESKYAYRNAARICPECGGSFIIKGKDEYGGGWLCFKKKGGCGAKFEAGDQVIEGQAEGKSENPDLADTYNTVLKMACKRALVAAVLNGTAASDQFTQDMEDRPPDDPKPASGSVPADKPFSMDETPTPAPATTAPPADDGAWVDAAAEKYGEAELIDAAEAVRQEMGIGAQITGLNGIRKATEGSSPHRRIIERLERVQSDPPEPSASPERMTSTEAPTDTPNAERTSDPSLALRRAEAKAVHKVSGYPGWVTCLSKVSLKGPCDECGYDPEDPENTLPIPNPCPICGHECVTWRPDDPKAPTWICSSFDCKDEDGHRWTSFHSDPWKPGGEIELMHANAKAVEAEPVQEALGA